MSFNIEALITLAEEGEFKPHTAHCDYFISFDNFKFGKTERLSFYLWRPSVPIFWWRLTDERGERRQVKGIRQKDLRRLARALVGASPEQDEELSALLTTKAEAVVRAKLDRILAGKEVRP